jgi:epoxyqueuosine reductase
MSGGLEERIRARGRDLGFRKVVFSPGARSPRAGALLRWLDRGFAGEMQYMKREPEGRADVTWRSPWVRTVISVALDYGSPMAPGYRPYESPANPARGRPEPRAEVPESAGLSGFVSRYALGRDYHDVLKTRLEELARFIRTEAPGRVETRALVDTSALLERDHASVGGLGWTGKNAMVIDPESGSYFFLGEILTDLELAHGAEAADLCGSCTKCLEACPTGAIIEPRVLDARRCISYLTIELRGSIPSGLRSSLDDHLFGCDVCQEVCPWNRRTPPAEETGFRPGPEVEETTLEDVIRMDTPAFAARFRGTALARAKRSGLVRNALIVAANRRDPAAVRAGRAILEDPDPMLRETAVWSLARGEPGERRLAAAACAREPDAECRERMREDLDDG